MKRAKLLSPAFAVDVERHGGGRQGCFLFLRRQKENVLLFFVDGKERNGNLLVEGHFFVLACDKEASLFSTITKKTATPQRQALWSTETTTTTTRRKSFLLFVYFLPTKRRDSTSQEEGLLSRISRPSTKKRDNFSFRRRRKGRYPSPPPPP